MTENDKTNWYEEKQERRRERLEARAERADAEARRRFKASDDAIAGIPPGQPILVGHHSEGRHRRALDRCHNHMRKGLDAQNDARHLRGQAAAVGTGGISSDDPEAIAKLRQKLARREEAQRLMVATNKAWRTWNKNPEAPAARKAMEALPQAMQERVRAYDPEQCYSWERKGPFPSYSLSNNNAEVRRLKQRLAQLEAAAERPAVPDVQGKGYTLRENQDINRIQFLFDGKPPPAVRQELKGRGFRWARSEGAWQRQLNNSGRWAAQCVVDDLAKLQAEED